MQRRTADVRASAFTDHVLVCTHDRENHAACADADGGDVYDAVADWLRERDVLWSDVQLAECSCLALCSSDGTAIAVHPRGEWYSDVTCGDVPTLLAELFGDDASRLGDGLAADARD
jgi:(2Fe-2S) ferredoxin